MLSSLSGLPHRKKWWREGLVIGAFVGYTIAYVLLYPSVGPIAASLSVLPAILIAWLYGLGIGMFGGVLAFLLNVVLMMLVVGHGDWLTVLRTNVSPGTFTLFVTCLVAGRIHDINVKLSKELARRIDTEKALQQAEENARQVADTAFEALVIHDGNTILDVNQAFCQMFGYSRREALGISWANLISPESRETIRQRIDSSDTRPYEALMIRKDGSSFWADYIGRPGYFQGKPVRIKAIRDAAERKRAEEQRLELVLARERAEVLKEFLNTVSHDLKTPLSVINTSLYLAEKQYDPQRRKEHLHAIREQTHRLERLIEDILTMSRLEAIPDLHLQFKPLTLAQLIQDVENNIRSLAEGKGQRVILDLPLGLPTILGDEDDLVRALTNLIENALIYTPADGTISVKIRVDGDDELIEIVDSGIGINAADIPHIFEAFFRSPNAREAHSGGTGLGLAIVKKIVDMHKGQIEVESAPGVGSIFRIRLPIMREVTSQAVAG